ncbi:MAG: hypothetical protein IIB40_10220, partial [Candidatus Marinimicrobia bacterium]|nr:hypothetical protein [Candidatus Neomarinimicrobiota bacterium]
SLREVALKRLAVMSESGDTETAPGEQDKNMTMPEPEVKAKNHMNHDQ